MTTGAASSKVKNVGSLSLVIPTLARARKTDTAPVQPTDDVT
jgi:hypothetical protein